ncbi:prion-inhibition and propagation-domain-containing protein [Triangularia verruculosa]|uniref:Prion-inhibition and propagation-domain-containing protein n=1 Tax=Triangularia verruculosa TaxID=2587418 RepID=A0AAN6XQE8_9PEZI|nr:prion-inhibition and propagation-domain-containing protein [Triangularia verruculosa]
MEIAAAAFQFTTTAVQAFRACIIAIEFFSTAQHMGADGDLFHTGLEFEKYRLMIWAERVGLLSDNERQTLNWQLAGIILGQLHSFLSSANTLRTRYSLDVKEEEVEAMEEEEAAEGEKKGVAKLLARLKPNLRTTAGKIIQEHNSPIKRLRWAARDREKLKWYLGQITELVSRLEVLLETSERQEERTKYGRLLRELISLTSTTSEAGQIKELVGDATRYQQSINAAAYLKQVRLVLGADKREDEITPKMMASETIGLRMPKLAVLGRSLKPWTDTDNNSTPLFESNLEFATYRQKQVLIQWKTVESTQWERYVKQMKCLVVFLTSLSSSDDSFRSLPCLGYYPLQDRSRHGIVYSMPEDPPLDRHNDKDQGQVTDWDYKSLRTLISSQPLVSLKRRLQLCLCLAETVLQLHTSGWLHKGLRPENILFLAPRGSSNTLFLGSDPYIAGYEYSRTDTVEAQKYTHLPDTELEADLYRHPDARGQGRETYQKRFDMYSLGCVILELAMWQPLVDIFAEFLPEKGNLKDLIQAAQVSNEVIELPELRELFEQEDAVRKIRYLAGEAVVEVLRTCFAMERKKAEDEGLLTEQMEVVERLGWCRI